MTTPTGTPAVPENAVIAALAEKAAVRQMLQIVPDKSIGLVLNEGQRLEHFDLESFQDFPFRKSGSVTLTDADSFVLYGKRHLLADATTLWTNVDKGTVTAVFDDHAEPSEGFGAPLPGWGEHRAVLTLQQTPDWLHWAGGDGKMVNQTAFAEFLEEGALSIKDPSAADMLEIAQSFQAKRGVAFKSSTRLTSGEIGLQYEETIDAKVGRKGSIEVPQVFTVALQPFEGSAAYELQARFRYRIHDGQLLLGYKLTRPDLVKRAAFADLTSVISEGLGLPVLAGAPR